MLIGDYREGDSGGIKGLLHLENNNNNNNFKPNPMKISN